jgi:hypothetical protein
MVQRASKDTSRVAKDHPVKMLLLPPVVGAPAGLATTLLAVSEWSDEAKVVVGLFAGGLGGTALVVFVLWVAKFASARRHQLEDRVGDLEEKIGEQREQLSLLTRDQLGDRDRFVTLYYDLRATLREARTKVESALDNDVLWDRTAVFNSKPWDKNKHELGTHPYAKADGIYGPCADAFEHVSRLNTVGVWRFGDREIKPGDNLEAALDALRTAEVALTSAIGEATPDQPS